MNKIIYTLMVLAISANLLLAQENRITPPAEDDVVVGAIGGNVDISALGGATYSIPIRVPDGIDGMQPNLSIVYNSQSGNGLLGWGWNLGGLSSITRAGHTNYHDGYMDGVDFEGDSFMLDGQRLMVLDGATYGSNGAQYKTEVDGMSKIVSYTGNGINGPKSFKVWTADGLILEYGNDDNARIVYHDGTNRDIVVIWLLNRIENREGNYVVYNYVKNNNSNNNNDYRLNDIQYSGHPGSKTTVYGINFHYYENRVDRECLAFGNLVLYQPWLLKDISIYHWSQPLSKYEFVYDEDSGQLNSYYYYNRLKEIHYEYEGVAVNPTVIGWGEYPNEIINPNNLNCQDFYLTAVDFNDPQGTFHNYVKFSGDFNGDGYSDVIVVGKPLPNNANIGEPTDSIPEKSVVRGMRIYLNEGHNKTDASAGASNFRSTEFTIFGQQTNIIYITDVNWIYVCDFNGDGLDDIVTFGQHYSYLNTQKTVEVEAFKSLLLQDGTWTLERILFDDNSLSACWFMYIGALQNATLLTGDFCGRNKDDLIVAINSGHSRKFHYFSYDEVRNQIYSYESAADWKGVTYATCDYDGDGKTEVWFADEGQPGKLVKLYMNQNGQYTYYQMRQCFDSNCILFTGDFNGDGCTDFLTFHSDRQVEGWEIVLGGVETTDFSFDVSTIMDNHTGGGDPGDYKYNFDSRESGVSMKYFVSVFDVDGDGKSDIVVRNNYNTSLLFSPLRKVSGIACFTIDTTYVSESIGFYGEDTYGICVGNFLGQESFAILHDKRLLSIPQHSIYYNVKDIIDGMGNQSTLEYDYLIHNPQKVQGDLDNNIYSLTDIGTDLSYNIYNTPLPIKAVSKLSATNVNLETGPIFIDSCSYENALIHRQGKGLLGFQKTIRDRWLVPKEPINNVTAKHQAKTVDSYNFKSMGEHCMNLLESEEVFRYQASTVSPDEFEEIKISSTTHCYQKFLCSRDYNPLGIKVFMPLENIVLSDNYELLGERSLLRRRISKSVFNGLNSTGPYQYANTVHATETWQGTDANSQNSVEDCEFQNHTIIEYENDLTNNWIINRPQTVKKESKRLTGGFAIEKSMIIYDYHSQKPYLPETVSYYPSWIVSALDKLSYKVEYIYIDGRVQIEKLSSINDTLNPRYTTYEYDPYYRFKTKVTNSYGHETSYQYDDVYGNLVSITDCNGYQTVSQNDDHLGITIRTYEANNDVTHTQINGTESVTALRWLEGSAYEQHAPGFGDPAYFSWTKSESSAETFIIYDAAGHELRSVSHELRDTGSNVIYKDTHYDIWGRVYQESEPYFSDTQSSDIKWTTYEYDDFDRITKINLPNYELDNEIVRPYVSTAYDGLVTTTESGAFIGVRKEAHTTETAVNVMGWTDYNKEYLDPDLTTFNITTYDYNANGSLAWTMVNEDDDTKVLLDYDIAGNRTVLHDPDYGSTQSHYDAFGQLQWQDTPKGDRTAYYYDNIGRLVIRTETDNSGAIPITDTTIWRFSGAEGTLGLLESIKLNNRQEITYTYDPLHYNNLQEVTEERSNTDYSTSYLYSDSNFPKRVSSVTYPSGYTIEKGYNAITGSLTEIRHNNQLLWKTHDANAMGQITDFEMGNGVHSYYQYDDRNLLSSQQASKSGNTIQNFGYVYDVFGNLAARREDKFLMPNTETFIYDDLNRLKSITLNGTVISDMEYDAFGRIIEKEADGQTVFSDAQYNIYDLYSNPKPHAISSATTANNSLFRPLSEITYTMFDKVKTLTQYDTQQNQTGGISFQYGYDHERISMVQGNTYEKQYWGNCELITQNGNTQWNTFISGPLGVFAAVTTGNNTEALRYIYKDHLGSWTTITDDQGVILQEMSFDAWGNLRAPGTWSGPYSGLILYDRGFTGHEHLFGYDLINMNGRMYDPVMSSFLSVDNYVQVPDFSQSFNRYAYCLNNPLSYTDPSGEIVWFVPVIIGAAIGAYTGASIQSGTAAFWNWKPDAWKGAIAGAIVGGTLGYGFAGAIGATGMTTITANGTIAVTKSAGLVSSMLNSGTVNITMNALSGGGWDGAWKAGVVGLATGCWNTSGGFGMVKGFGTTSDIGKLAGKLGYQMIGTAGGSIGNNWARGEDPFSKVTLGVGPINLTLGKKQMPFQLKNNWENIITNVLGLGNLAFGGKVNFDWKNLSLNYYGGLVDKMFPTTLYENGIIYDQYSGFGAHSVIGNSNLFNADYDIYSHELHHLWQSRAFGNAFVFNYVLQGIEAMSMGGSFLEIYNYFEDIANRRFWW